MDLVLEAVEDGFDEAEEELIIDLYNPQSGYVYKTLEVMLSEATEADFNHFTVTPLEFEFVALDVAPGMTISWDFGDGSPVQTGATVTYAFPITGAYEVCMTATDAAGCDWMQCRTVETVATGLTDPTRNIRIQPNPASDYVILDGVAGMATVRIYDAAGRLIKESAYSNQLDVQQLPAGLYTLELQQEDVIRRAKLVIE